MATMRSIIDIALRKIRVIASGETPGPDEAADALRSLQSLYESWVSGGMFGRLSNKLTDTEYTAGENQRILVQTGGSVILPELVEDDCGDERAPRNRAVVVVVEDGAATTHLYDAAAAGWVALNDLGLDDEAPLSNRDADGLACCLAEVLAEEYGSEAGPATQRRAASFRFSLANGYDDPRRIVGACYY